MNETTKQQIASVMQGFRLDVTRDLEEDGETLEVTSDFSSVLYELGQRFELNPTQHAQACGHDAYGQFGQEPKNGG